MKQPNNKIIAMYCRVANSIDDPFAIRQQEKKVQTFAAENGYTIRAVYLDNGYSGLSADRPALLSLMGDIEAGKIERVIMTDASRLFRDPLQIAGFFDLCGRNDVAVTTIEECPSRPCVPDDALLNAIAALYGQRKSRVAR
jgi:DNA invertase Pin-like site-specific DNA recombinase